MPLPGHAESYNPPPEYLLTDQEKVQINGHNVIYFLICEVFVDLFFVCCIGEICGHGPL